MNSIPLMMNILFEKPQSTQSMVLDILSKLISFDTTSGKSNEELLNFVEECFDKNISLKGQRFPCFSTVGSNFLITLSPNSECMDSDVGLVFQGHSDVVPIKDQIWSFDPFTLNQQDGKLFGRGTCDMKGYLACCISVFLSLDRSKLKKPVSLLITTGEEIGCLGTHELMNQHPGVLTNPLGIVVGEPTEMFLVLSHKGKANFEVNVISHSVHASLAPKAISSIVCMAEIVKMAEQINSRWKENIENHNVQFDFGYPWINFGVIEGGTSPNTVPGFCRAVFEIRTPPDIDPNDIASELIESTKLSVISKMREIDPSIEIIFTRLTWTPGLINSDSNSIFTNNLLRIRSLDFKEVNSHVSFGTEAGIFHSNDIPTIVCGPGSIRQAHTADEWITLEQIDRCINMINQLVNHFCYSDEFS